MRQTGFLHHHPDGCSSCKIALLNRVVVLQGNSGFGGFLISVSGSVALSMCFFSLHWDFCVCIFGVSASSPSVPGIWFLYPRGNLLFADQVTIEEDGDCQRRP